MKKTRRILCLLCAVLLGCSLFACTPAADTAGEAAAIAEAAAPSDPIEAAATADELNALIKLYQTAGDFDGVYRAALKLTELEPDNADACLTAAGALLAINEQNEQEMKRILALNLANAPGNSEIVSDWLDANGLTGAVELPFIPDYADASQINTDGNSSGNMSNILLSGYWRGGFVATQADWIYFSRFTGDYAALYKMRTDGSNLQKFEGVHGYSLNVVGDWLYFINPDDAHKPCRMHTDGSQLQKIADHSCSYLTVSGDWAYSDGFGENGALGKFRVDGSEQTALTDFTISIPVVCDEWVYFMKKSMEDGGLLRIRTDGTEMSRILDLQPPFVFCITDEAIYYTSPGDNNSVYRMNLDGSEPVEVFKADDIITAMNVSEGKLIVAYGISFDKDGLLLSNFIVVVDLESGAVLKQWDAHTDPLSVGEGFLFYTEDGKGMAWQCVNLETFEEIPME